MVVMLILLAIIMIGLTSFFIGSFLFSLLNIRLSKILLIPVGFFGLIGITNFFAYIIVFFHLPTYLLFILYFLMIFVSVAYVFKKRVFYFKFEYFKNPLVFFLIVYVFIMILISSRQTIAEQSFDTIIYLSTVLEGAFANTFTSFDVDSGVARNYIFPIDDYQSYYYFGSFVILLIEKIIKFISKDVFVISTSVFMWSFSILFYVINFLMTVTFIRYLKIKSKLINLSLGIFVLFFIGNFYYNNTYAFYGNSYRTLIIALMMFIMYVYLNEGLDIRPISTLLMLLSSALIAVSASGYFIGLFAIYGFITYLINNKLQKDILFSVLLKLSIPTVFFVIFYVAVDSLLKLTVLSGVMIILYTALYFANKAFPKITLIILKNATNYVIPTLIVLISIYLIWTGYMSPSVFFKDTQSADMAWSYFEFIKFPNSIVNILYLLGLFIFILKSRSKFKWILLIIIGTFINPISIIFVYRFLTGHIFYRGFDSILNSFTIVLFLYSVLNLFSKQFLNVILFVLTLVLAIYQSTGYYHFYFIPSEDFSPIYKTEQSQVEIFEFLKSKIIFEEYDRARVVSQIHSIKGFVPNIETPVSFNFVRVLNKFEGGYVAHTPLHNIFIYRDYFGQKIYNTEPEYINTCYYLIDIKTDFIVVAKNQSFDNNGEVKFLYHVVRECSTQVFENDEYFVYQMFWK